MGSSHSVTRYVGNNDVSDILKVHGILAVMLIARGNCHETIAIALGKNESGGTCSLVIPSASHL
jgi:hypothetical protein